MCELDRKEVDEISNILDTYKNRWSRDPRGFCYEQAKGILPYIKEKEKQIVKEVFGKLKEKSISNGKSQSEFIDSEYDSLGGSLSLAEIIDLAKEYGVEL